MHVYVWSVIQIVPEAKELGVKKKHFSDTEKGHNCH